jgi:hypothetical protein
METLSLGIPGNLQERPSVPGYLYVTVLSSFCIIVGLIWDISWHMSIGRDGLFSAPHLAIYLGGVTAGLFSGYNVLKISFAGTREEKGRSVKFWGIFYGSLGNLFCIWGAIAMLTSAPFDDWWHNTYGLDVTILSPPHTVLLLGMIIIQFGAIISVLAYQNLGSETRSVPVTKRFNLLYSLSAGFVLCMTYTMASEYLGRHQMHGLLFYQISSLLFPLLLSAYSISSKSRWGAAQACVVYSLFMMAMGWILPLFPAVPRLGPVLNPVTTFQPFDFPLLLIIPAIGIDLITQRYSSINHWLLAFAFGACFLVLFIAAQWPFANVLMASKGHWFFGTSKWYFGSDPDWEYRYAFPPWNLNSTKEWAIGIPIALAIATIAARIGISWGHWLKRIVR